jgi:FkbM family methyltransferase
MSIDEICDVKHKSSIGFHNYYPAPNTKTLLYGCGEAAKKIYPHLVAEGISIDHVVIDKKYLKDQISFFEMQVEALEDIILRNDKLIVIVGMSDENLIIENKLKQITNIENIIKIDYCIFYPGYRFTREFIISNFNHFKWLSNILQDQRSKDTLIAYINQRISGDMGYLRSLKTARQYYPDQIIEFENENTYIDCGAYTGDTISELFSFMIRDGGKFFSKSIAFEPDKINFDNLLQVVSSIPNVECHNKGVWSFSGELKFFENGYLNSSISDEGNISIPVAAIDDSIGNAIPTFIKMDIEGSELEALRGATKIISKYKPKLAICVYHKNEDLIEIPKLILSLRDDYKLYLRSHHYDSEEVVLYAV